MDWRRKPPLLSSPDPSCRVAPRVKSAATSASGSRLTTRERKRLRSPSVASGKHPYRCRATTRLRTASPRNSSRSLLGPEALRWVSAARNSAGSRGSYPKRSRSQRAGQSALVKAIPGLTAAAAGSARMHPLVEGQAQRDIGEQRHLVIVGHLHDPTGSVTRDLQVPGGREVHHVDLEVLVDHGANGSRVAPAILVIARHLIERPR